MPYAVAGMSAITTDSMMRGVSTGENMWGLDERSSFLSDILGLLLFQRAQNLLANSESLDKVSVRRAHK